VEETVPESETNEAEERRAFERIFPRGAVLRYAKRSGFLGGLFGGKSLKRPASLRNLSRIGACFLCRERLRVGQKLAMSIRLGERGPNVLVVGKVVCTNKGRGSNPFQIGVRFVDYRANAWNVLSHLEDHVQERDESTTTMLRRMVREQPTEAEQTEQPQSGLREP
jgi:Tfp pilus assembly protein PilZ